MFLIFLKIPIPISLLLNIYCAFYLFIQINDENHSMYNKTGVINTIYATLSFNNFWLMSLV